MARKQWKELSAGQRWGVVLSASAQLALLATALLDIYRGPAEEIRGSKPVWAQEAWDIANSGNTAHASLRCRPPVPG